MSYCIHFRHEAGLQVIKPGNLFIAQVPDIAQYFAEKNGFRTTLQCFKTAIDIRQVCATYNSPVVFHDHGIEAFPELFVDFHAQGLAPG